MKTCFNKIGKLFDVLIVLLLVLTMMESQMVMCTANDKKAINVYKKALEKAEITLDGDSYKASNCTFALADINHDGTPELFIRDMSPQTVYTYNNGKIVKVQSFSYGGNMLAYYEKGNILQCGTLNRGYFYETTFQLSKSKLRSVASWSFEDDGTDTGQYNKYYIGKKAVNKNKYEKYIKKISKSSKSHEIEYHEISTGNIKKYCK